MPEVRVAAASRDEGPVEIAPQPASVAPPATPLPVVPIAPPKGEPRIVHPEQPASLPDARREKPTEPRQFIAPKAIRISDE
jgi:hypothetical protein